MFKVNNKSTWATSVTSWKLFFKEIRCNMNLFSWKYSKTVFQRISRNLFPQKISRKTSWLKQSYIESTAFSYDVILNKLNLKDLEKKHNSHKQGSSFCKIIMNVAILKNRLRKCYLNSDSQLPKKFVLFASLKAL